jgi:hypothetical protein
VKEVTQPQGHSTSGSHERYKSAERLAWEREWDCIKKFREWIVLSGLATDDELNAIAQEAKILVKEARNNAWEKFIQAIKVQVQKTAELLNEMVVNDMDVYRTIQQKVTELQKNIELLRRDVLHTLNMAMEMAPNPPSYNDIQRYYNSLLHENNQLYNSHVYNDGNASALKVETVKPLIPFDEPVLNGYEILNRYFDILFANNPKVLAFGEDVGNIGDVNQGFAGLQAKHGNTRIFDTGIRELTIMGQAIGLA